MQLVHEAQIGTSYVEVCKYLLNTTKNYLYYSGSVSWIATPRFSITTIKHINYQELLKEAMVQTLKSDGRPSRVSKVGEEGALMTRLEDRSRSIPGSCKWNLSVEANIQEVSQCLCTIMGVVERLLMGGVSKPRRSEYFHKWNNFPPLRLIIEPLNVHFK